MSYEHGAFCHAIHLGQVRESCAVLTQPQGTPHACVTHDADSHACRQAGEATGEASCQVRIAVEQVVWLVGSLVDCSPRTLAQTLLCFACRVLQLVLLIYSRRKRETAVDTLCAAACACETVHLLK